jgi:hypothetical protein
VGFPENDDVRQFRIVGHFVWSVSGVEYLITHLERPVGPVRAPYLVVMVRLGKKVLKAHFDLPAES